MQTNAEDIKWQQSGRKSAMTTRRETELQIFPGFFEIGHVHYFPFCFFILQFLQLASILLQALINPHPQLFFFFFTISIYWPRCRNSHASEWAALPFSILAF